MEKMPVYVVNLKEQDSLKESLKNSLEKFGLLEKAFFLDTCRFEYLEYNEQIFWNNMYSNRYNIFHINKPSLGCLSSHYKIWNMILDNKDDNALIFEEDVFFEDKFIEYFNNLELPHDFDILFLGGNYVEKPIQENSGVYIRNVNKECALTTEAYIISRKCARKLVDLIDLENYYLNDKGKKGFYNVDWYIHKLCQKSILNHYYLSPFICYQNKFR